MAAVIASLGKVRRTAKGAPARMTLGEHTFTLADGTKTTENVIAVDGWPGVIIPTVEGRKWVAMDLDQARKALNRDGTWRWWGYWQVRDLPEYAVTASLGFTEEQQALRRSQLSSRGLVLAHCG